MQDIGQVALSLCASVSSSVQCKCGVGESLKSEPCSSFEGRDFLIKPRFPGSCQDSHHLCGPLTLCRDPSWSLPALVWWAEHRARGPRFVSLHLHTEPRLGHPHPSASVGSPCMTQPWEGRMRLCLGKSCVDRNIGVSVWGWCEASS